MSSELPLAEALLEIERLRKLVEASKLINSSIEGEALYESILTVARRETREQHLQTRSHRGF